MPDSDPLAPLVSLEGVPSAFAAARDGIDVLLRDRGPRRTTPADTAESLLRGAWASAVLAGSSVTLEDVRAGSQGPTAVACVRLSTALLGQVPVLRTTPVQALAQLDLAAGGDGSPVSAEGAARLQQLGRTLLATSAPALLVAAVVHADIVAAAPFGERSGVVARAAERVVLAARGVDPKSLIVPEAGHLALREAYESNLRGYSTGGVAGLHSWLLYAAEAYARGAEESPLARRG